MYGLYMRQHLPESCLNQTYLSGSLPTTLFKSQCIEEGEPSLNVCIVILELHVILSWSPTPLTIAKIPEPTLKDLMNLVKTDKPIKLGLQLGVNENDLAVLDKDHPNDHDKQLSKVLSLYMRQSVNPSWMEVTTALWNIGENRIAQQITDYYGMAFLMCISMCLMSYM